MGQKMAQYLTFRLRRLRLRLLLRRLRLRLLLRRLRLLRPRR
jgi:hypothetical protein